MRERENCRAVPRAGEYCDLVSLCRVGGCRDGTWALGAVCTQGTHTGGDVHGLHSLVSTWVQVQV